MDTTTLPWVAVVDDEAAIRRALLRLLRAAGIPARDYDGGAALLAALQDGADGTPFCVVLDLHMPGMSGFDLQQRLAELASSPARRKLVVTDAVFSMDGDVADIPALLALCERYDALLLIDDAHGFGVLGAPGQEGRGTLAHYGLAGENASPRILYMATLGKAAGVAGAFVAGSEVLVEWLLQKTRSYIFATAAPALLAKALQASVQVMQTETWRYTHLQQLIARLRAGLAPLLARTPRW
eukprot:gene33786-41679_t